MVLPASRIVRQRPGKFNTTTFEIITHFSGFKFGIELFSPKHTARSKKYPRFLSRHRS
jgi:hypothetical protein